MEIADRNIGALIRRLALFYVVMLTFWAVSLFWWLSYGYEGTFLWLNQYHWLTLDQLDLYFFTHLGDGLILPGMLVLIIWRKNPGLAVTAILALVVCGLLAQLGKTTLFSDWSRPAKALMDVAGLEIVHPHPPHSRSFPSGHATTMATGGVFFAYFFYSVRSWLPALVGLFTVFLCFSRVVIGVHFPGDIFVGSVLGALGGFMFLWLLYPGIDKVTKKVVEERFPKLMALVLWLTFVIIIAQFINLIVNI
ncbi:MAG TPA: phosphatase PAP2 family protein [Bacteroidetes bacterium]|nr:phosphatase PAP2 family protein [Bacteroidota bacterium]